MNSHHDGASCAECSVEERTLRLLKSERDKLIRVDENHAITIDILANSYARLAVATEAMSAEIQEQGKRLQEIAAQLAKMRNVKWWLSGAVGVATVAQQLIEVLR